MPVHSAAVFEAIADLLEIEPVDYGFTPLNINIQRRLYSHGRELKGRQEQ